MSSISGISFSGLASGLDTSAIVKKLIALERRPITLLQRRKSLFSTKGKLLNTFESKLDALKSAANTLRKSTTLIDFMAQTDNEGYVTASAGSSAKAGSYVIDVATLAQAQVNTSAGKADKDSTTHGTGLLKFTINGTDSFVTIDGTNNTLDGIASAVNAAGIGITASVLDTGAASNPYKLVFQASTQGTDGAFTVGTDSADPTLVALAAEIDGTVTTVATDASFTLDGVSVTRSSNTFSDVIEGVTITLTGVHPASSPANTTLTVSTDSTKTAEKVKKFVDAYNDVVAFIKDQQKVTINEDAGTSSILGGSDNGPKTKTNPLFGDSALSQIRRGLRDILGKQVATGNEAVSLLSQVGIDADRDGTLTFDEDEFASALGTDEAAVRKLFTDASVGIAETIYTTVDNYLDPIDGVIKSRLDGIDRSKRDIDKQIRTLEDRVKKYEEFLTEKFANLEAVMGRLQSQMGALVGLQSPRK